MIVLHPVQRFDVADLIEELARRPSLVRVSRDGPLSLYCYSQSCVYAKAWDDVTVLARGLVIDTEEKRVVARPFPKFFNYGERPIILPQDPFDVQEKVDGSLVIVFHDGKQWRCVTKGSFTSTQAAWAEVWLANKWNYLEEGSTYLFEAVYHANRIVVRYADECLVLLGAYDRDGEEYDHAELKILAAALGTRAVEIHPFDSIDDAISHAAGLGRDSEGFVVRFANGFRVKIKGAEYLRIHRLMSHVTPLAVWESIMNGDDLGAIRRELPEECWGDFDRIESIIVTKLHTLIGDVFDEAAARADQTDKEVGLALATMPAHVRPFIFAARKRPDLLNDPKARAGLFRAIRPNGNVLDGYSPCDLLQRMAGV